MDPSGGIDPGVVVGLAVAGALTLLAITAVVRRATMNARRRARGQEPLSWTQLAALRRARTRAGSSTPADVEHATELQRQVEWERAQFGMELARYGRATTRAWCARHDRHCTLPHEDGHQPGGPNFVAAPEDFVVESMGPLEGL